MQSSAGDNQGDQFVGLDVGTQGARAVACDAAGNVAAWSSRSFERASPQALPPGWSEQRPGAWWDAACACLKELVGLLGKSGRSSDRIAAVSVDSTSGTILLVEPEGTAIGTAILYNDSRTAAESERANNAAGPFLDKLGYRFQPGFGLPKILWLAQHRPSDFARAGWIAHPADYLLWRLGASRGLTDASNALKSGYDLIDRRWPQFISGALGVPAGKLLRVVNSGEVIGEVSHQAADETGLREGTRLVAGATDGSAGFLASGAVREGDWNCTLGTTLVLRGISRSLIKDPKGRVYCHSHPGGRWLPGAASSVGGECLAKLFASADLAALDREVPKFIPNALLIYPLVRKGERFPFVEPDASGFVIGQPASEAENYAAYLEAVALVERWSLDVMRELGAPTGGELFASGGSIRSDAWLQLRADVLGRPLNVSSRAESAVGAAILAAAGAAFGSVDEAVRRMVCVDRSFEPRREHARYFQDKCARLREACRQRGYT